LYQSLWATSEYRNPERSERYYAKIDPGDANTIIDIGIGTGRLAQLLTYRGYEVEGWDIASNCLDEGINVPLHVAPLWEHFDKKYDFSICVDVLEHIPEERIFDSIFNALDVAPHGYWLISTEENHRGLHLTVRDGDWWTDILRWADVVKRDGCVEVFF